MLKHEAKLIDPTVDEIVPALTTAVGAANKRCRARLLTDDPAKWRKFARAAAAKREGYEMFRGGRGGVPATQVLAAWWTDAIGRKHVVLRGRRIEHDEAKRLLQQDQLDQRPPLWHAYPEYVCQRAIGAGTQLVCACGCGAVGTPEALGWMGETCGPCFDRKEELGSAGLRTNLPGVLYGDREPLFSVACSPDGNRVAAVEGNDGATYWDIATRTRTVMTFTGIRVMGVAITPDGRHLLVTGVGTVDSTAGLFAAFDLSADPPRRVDPARTGDPPAWRVFALPDPTLALVHQTTSLFVQSCRAAVVRVPSGAPGAAPLELGGLHPIAVSPDGKRLLAWSGASLSVYDRDTGEIGCELHWAYAYQWAAFAHDGTRLIAANDNTLRAFDADTGKPCSPGARHATPGNWISALAVDPTGKWVFVGGPQGTVSVADARTLERRALFEWHLGVVRGLAVSADGSRLFSSGGDGCVKVWPIRDLMKGV
jgi:DNA-binding beta-propeller fold protein YncE